MVVSTVIIYIVLNTLHYERNNTYDKAAHSEPSQTFETELFAKIVNGIKQRSSRH